MVVISGRTDFYSHIAELKKRGMDIPEKRKDPVVLRELPTFALIGIFGYDEFHANSLRMGNDVGLTGCHLNYWKVANDIGEELSSFLGNRGFRAKFTGEGPLPTKYILYSKGIAKYGKNSLTYIGKYGSWISNWVYLFTDAPLSPDQANEANEPTMCGSCNVCMEKCPTDAIYEPFKVDAERCIARLTTQGADMPEEMRGKIGNWIWGCDICQIVCPANLKVVPRKRAENAGLYHPVPCQPPEHTRSFPRLLTELNENYNKYYLGNVLIALGNVGNSGALTAVEDFLKRARWLGLEEYCNWALKRLGNRIKRPSEQEIPNSL